MAKQGTMTVSVVTKVATKERKGFFKTRSGSTKKESHPMEVIPENIKFLDIEYI